MRKQQIKKNDDLHWILENITALNVDFNLNNFWTAYK